MTGGPGSDQPVDAACEPDAPPGLTGLTGPPVPPAPPGLTLRIELLTGSYDAARADDREAAEWPPHPSRLFCALVAAARTEAEREALRWLEAQEPPLVHAADPVGVQRRQGYVVTNARDARGGHVVYPGRTAHLRVRVRTLVADPTVRVVWPTARPDPDQVEILDRLARRVPYLGRSTGTALLSVESDAGAAFSPSLGPGGPDHLEAPRTVPAAAHREAAPRDGGAPVPHGDEPGPELYRPCPMSEADVELGVPYRGYLQELDLLHHQGRPAWEALRTRGYRCRMAHPGRKAVGDPAVRSEAPEALVLRFVNSRPEGRSTARFTQALRHKAMACTADPLPAALHGHCTDGRTHVAFLALPDVGPADASGRLRALAVLFPALSAADRRAVLHGLLHGREADGSVPLHGPGIGRVRLRVAGLTAHQALGFAVGGRAWAGHPVTAQLGTAASPPAGGQEAHARRPSWLLPSRRWTSVTPVVLDRFPRKGAVESEVIRSVLQAGLPEPVEVAVSLAPLLPGGVPMRSADLPDSLRARLFRHVSLVFDRPVAGPILLGAGRYLGVGVFVGG